MMEIMAKERNGQVCAMDHRYCIDNGAMIAQAGVLQYQYGELTPMSDATCTQRYILPYGLSLLSMQCADISRNDAIVCIDSEPMRSLSFGATTNRFARTSKE